MGTSCELGAGHCYFCTMYAAHSCRRGATLHLRITVPPIGKNLVLASPSVPLDFSQSLLLSRPSCPQNQGFRFWVDLVVFWGGGNISLGGFAALSPRLRAFVVAQAIQIWRSTRKSFAREISGMMSLRCSCVGGRQPVRFACVLLMHVYHPHPCRPAPSAYARQSRQKRLTIRRCRGRTPT